MILKFTCHAEQNNIGKEFVPTDRLPVRRRGQVRQQQIAKLSEETCADSDFAFKLYPYNRLIWATYFSGLGWMKDK